MPDKPGLTSALSVAIVLLATLAVTINTASGVEVEEEVIVTGSQHGLPGEKLRSVFGFDKSLLEIPRSASSISEEVLERFGIYDIDELLALVPGTFTQSAFGAAGGPDVRGTTGETYFRGVRRLDNPSNYPTPLGAAGRIDIVRGPASPIYGPSKIGGYLNLTPKSARVEATGAFIPETTGALSYNFGSWDKSIVTAEIGGPAGIGGRDAGYYLYTELENSGSYYNYTETDQYLLQGAWDMDLSDNIQIQLGGMWHDHVGNENAGWNRVTQDLIDHGTYTTGEAKPLDTNGDGRVSHQEYDTDNDGFSDFDRFRDGVLIPGSAETYAELEAEVGDLSALNLVNPGSTTIDGSTVLVEPEDLQKTEVLTLYFDLVGTVGNGWEWKNQFFYEQYDHLTEDNYGYSRLHNSWVIEDKLVLAKTFSVADLTASIQLSPSIRHTNFENADDLTNEHFDRRDLTRPPSALSRRLLATQSDKDYTSYYIGDYTDFGFAAMADIVWENGFNALLGVRYDTISMQSRQPADKLLFASADNLCVPPGDCAMLTADGNVDGFSWTVSLSYATAIGLIPYITASRQSTMITGQGAEVSVGNVLSGGVFDQSELLEAGLKGNLLDERLYFALAFYRQERTDFSAQSIVTNQASETEGVEFELRWAVNDKLLLTAGYSHIEVTNLATEQNGHRFSFIGCDDLPNIPCHLLYGGTINGNVSNIPSGSRRAGVPEDIFSVTGTYNFGNGLIINGSVINVESVASGYSNSVTLPGYTLLNMGISYRTKHWLFSISGKNLTDARYFRSNFPNLFGSVVVLPELPRHYGASLQYRF